MGAPPHKMRGLFRKPVWLGIVILLLVFVLAVLFFVLASTKWRHKLYGPAGNAPAMNAPLNDPSQKPDIVST